MIKSGNETASKLAVQCLRYSHSFVKSNDAGGADTVGNERPRVGEGMRDEGEIKQNNGPQRQESNAIVIHSSSPSIPHLPSPISHPSRPCSAASLETWRLGGLEASHKAQRRGVPLAGPTISAATDTRGRAFGCGFGGTSFRPGLRPGFKCLTLTV